MPEYVLEIQYSRYNYFESSPISPHIYTGLKRNLKRRNGYWSPCRYPCWHGQHFLHVTVDPVGLSHKRTQKFSRESFQSTIILRDPNYSPRNYFISAFIDNIVLIYKKFLLPYFFNLSVFNLLCHVITNSFKVISLFLLSYINSLVSNYSNPIFSGVCLYFCSFIFYTSCKERLVMFLFY